MPKQITVYSSDEVIEVMLRAIDSAGSQREFARLHGISEPWVSLLLHGHKPISDRLARRLGFKAERVYTKGTR